MTVFAYRGVPATVPTPDDKNTAEGDIEVKLAEGKMKVSAEAWKAFQVYQQHEDWSSETEKTDYTYSRLSSYRHKEVIPGFPVRPNLCRSPIKASSPASPYDYSAELLEQRRNYNYSLRSATNSISSTNQSNNNCSSGYDTVDEIGSIDVTFYQRLVAFFLSLWTKASGVITAISGRFGSAVRSAAGGLGTTGGLGNTVRNASLSFASVFVAIWTGIAALFHRSCLKVTQYWSKETPTRAEESQERWITNNAVILWLKRSVSTVVTIITTAYYSAAETAFAAVSTLNKSPTYKKYLWLLLLPLLILAGLYLIDGDTKDAIVPYLSPSQYVWITQSEGATFLYETARSSLQSTGLLISDGVASTVEAAVEGFSSLLTCSTDIISYLCSSFGALLSNAANNLGSFLSNSSEYICACVGDVWLYPWVFLKNIWDLIKDSGVYMCGSIADGFGDLWAIITTGIFNLWAALFSVFSHIWGLVINSVDYLLQLVLSSFSGAWQSTQHVYDVIISTVVGSAATLPAIIPSGPKKKTAEDLKMEEFFAPIDDEIYYDEVVTEKYHNGMDSAVGKPTRVDDSLILSVQSRLKVLEDSLLVEKERRNVHEAKSEAALKGYFNAVQTLKLQSADSLRRCCRWPCRDVVPPPTRLAQDVNIEEVIREVEHLMTTFRGEIAAEIANLRLDMETTRSAGSVGVVGGSFDGAMVKMIVDAAIKKYDADKTGRADYALQSAGGRVVSIRCTKAYINSSPQWKWLSSFLTMTSGGPEEAIRRGMAPGECWAFQGAVGQLALELSHPIRISGFTMEHIAKELSPAGSIDSAPQHFSVWGLNHADDLTEQYLFGEYIFKDNGETLQYFPVLFPTDVIYKFVELKIVSNHGHPEYTCLYRIRVHGKVT